MAVDLKSVKNIDERSNIVVFGYLRRIQHISSVTHTPDLISFTCLCFYGRYIADYFSKTGANIEINGNSKVITNTNLLINSFNTAYGSNIIHPLHPSASYQYLWKFKIINQNGDIYIGIDCGGSWMNANFAQKTANPNYSYCSDGYKYSNNKHQKYLEPYSSNDLVSMKLDIQTTPYHSAVLYFKKENDKRWKRAFNIKANNNKLRMSVALKGGGTYGNYTKSSVELIDYSESELMQNGQSHNYKKLKINQTEEKQKRKKKEIAGTYYEEEIYDKLHGHYVKNPYYARERRANKRRNYHYDSRYHRYYYPNYRKYNGQ